MATTKTLVIDQGATFYSNIQYLDNSKHPISLVGYDVRSKMRKSYNSSNSATIGVVVTDAANGNIQLTLTADETATLRSGRYVYDVTANLGNIKLRVVEGIVVVNPTASGVSTGSLFQSPVNVKSSDMTTANVAEYQSLYYTNARVQAYVDSILPTYNEPAQFSNLEITGTLTRSVYNTGEVVKVSMYSANEINIINTTVAGTTNYEPFADLIYTPVSPDVRLIIEFITKYTVSGAGDDSYSSQIDVDGTQIAYNSVSYTEGGDGSNHRIGTLFPLMGRCDIANSDPKLITISAKRDSADDLITIYNDNSMWLKVTEVAI